MTDQTSERDRQTKTGVIGSSGPWPMVLAAISIAALGSLVLTGAMPSPGEWVWLAGFVISFVIRFPHVQANKANTITTSAHDRSERILLPGMFLAMMLLPLVTIATPFLDFAAYQLPGWVIGPAVVLQVAYLWLFWRSHADLGRNWSPGLETRSEHQIVDSGVYARIRHPMYAAIWLHALSQPLLVQNWIGGAFILVAFSAMYFIRVPREEAMLVERFGEAYQAYMTRTGRLWPGKRSAFDG
jgi:protein-S-isoprenylcysteine O-methyltransferase Ste14